MDDCRNTGHKLAPSKSNDQVTTKRETVGSEERDDRPYSNCFASLLTLETTTHYSPEPLPTKAYLTNPKGVQRLPCLGERPHPGPAHLTPTLELPTLPLFRALCLSSLTLDPASQAGVSTASVPRLHPSVKSPSVGSQA